MLTQETLETGSPDLHLMKALLFPESLTLADSPAGSFRVKGTEAGKVRFSSGFFC